MHQSENQQDRAGCVVQSVFTASIIIIFTIITLGFLNQAARTPVEAEAERAASIVSQAETAAESPAEAAVVPTSTDLPAPTATPVPPTATPVPPTAEPIEVATEPSGDEATEETAASSADESADTASASALDPAMVAEGQTLFTSACTACHGMDARGVTGLGKDLVASEFVHSISDEELIAFIKTGRPAWDPANTTGIDMPPKGGNPAITDEQLASIVAYIRSLNTAQ